MKFSYSSLIGILMWSSFTWASPSTLNFQALIKKPDGAVLEESSVNFRLKYKDPSNSNCTIYAEDFLNVSMIGSNGNVSFRLGSGTPVFPTSGTTLLKTFSNTPQTAYTCAEGGTFSPTASSRRSLTVEFIYSGVSSQKIEDIEINSVPYAMYAYESQNANTLGGVSATLYTKFADFATCTGGDFLTYDGQYFTCQTPGSTGVSGTVLSLTGDITGTLSATVVTSLRGTPLASMAPTSGQYLRFNGTNWSPQNLTLTSGTVTNVVATAPLTVTSSTTTPTLSMAAADGSNNGYLTSANFTTFNNKLGTSTSMSGDVSGTYNNLTVNKIKGYGLTFTSIASGNFLKYNGSAWVNATPSISDITSLSTTLSSKLDQSQMPSACGSGESLAFSSPTGTWFCSTIVIDASQITGTIAPDRLFNNVVEYTDGSERLEPEKLLEFGYAGVIVRYTDKNFRNRGEIILPDLRDPRIGWQIKIIRDSGTYLRINTVDDSPFYQNQSSLIMHSYNLSSITIMSVATKDEPEKAVWKVINEVQDCQIGKPCGDENNIYIGLMRGHQYFTTIGNCDHHAECTGGDDSTELGWAEGSGNSAYGRTVGASRTNDGKRQSKDLADQYDDTTIAKVCEGMDLTSRDTDLSDWYLPTVAEFDLLLNNKASIEGFMTKFDRTNNYWTSVEADDNNAVMYMQTKFGYTTEDKTARAKFRCIRRW